jgi:hypothetical protein
MSGIKKRSNSSRTVRRRKLSSSIVVFGSFSYEPCQRCRQYELDCIVMEEGRCSQCVSTGNERSCDACGPSHVVRKYLEEKEILKGLQKEMAELSAKIVRQTKVVDHLEAKSLQEAKDLVVELEAEGELNRSSHFPVPSSLVSSTQNMEWFDRLYGSLAPVTEVPRGFVDETS